MDEKQMCLRCAKNGRITEMKLEKRTNQTAPVPTFIGDNCWIRPVCGVRSIGISKFQAEALLKAVAMYSEPLGMLRPRWQRSSKPSNLRSQHPSSRRTGRSMSCRTPPRLGKDHRAPHCAQRK